jgi:hypothetical protein
MGMEAYPADAVARAAPPDDGAETQGVSVPST